MVASPACRRSRPSRQLVWWNGNFSLAPAVQYLDGPPGRNVRHPLFPRRGTTDRATGAGLQIHRRWAKSLALSGRGHTSRSFLDFLLCGVMLWVYYQHFPMAIPIPETQTGRGYQSLRFHFPDFHADGGASLAERISNRRHPLRRDVLGQFRPQRRSLRSPPWISSNPGGPSTERGFLFALSKYSTVIWGAGADRGRLPQPRGPRFVLNGGLLLRGLTAAPPGWIGAGALLEKGASAASGRRHAWFLDVY